MSDPLSAQSARGRGVFAKRVPYFCEHFITAAELGSADEWAGTYCKLQVGHSGPHSPLYADEHNAVASDQGAS